MSIGLAFTGSLSLFTGNVYSELKNKYLNRLFTLQFDLFDYSLDMSSDMSSDILSDI